MTDCHLGVRPGSGLGFVCRQDEVYLSTTNESVTTQCERLTPCLRSSTDDICDSQALRPSQLPFTLAIWRQWQENSINKLPDQGQHWPRLAALAIANVSEIEPVMARRITKSPKSRLFGSSANTRHLFPSDMPIDLLISYLR